MYEITISIILHLTIDNSMDQTYYMVGSYKQIGPPPTLLACYDIGHSETDRL